MTKHALELQDASLDFPDLAIVSDSLRDGGCGVNSAWRDFRKQNNIPGLERHETDTHICACLKPCRWRSKGLSRQAVG